MIKLSVAELLNAEEALFKLKAQAEDPDNSLGFILSYKLLKLINKLRPEYVDIHAQQNKILSKFGKKENKGDEEHWIISPDKQEQFNKYWNQLMSIKIEVFNVFKFNWRELSPVKNISITHVEQLNPFIEEEIFEKQKERTKIDISFDN